MSQKSRQALMVLCSLVCVSYLVYRGLFTLNLESAYAAAASWSLYLAEIWGTFSLVVFFLQVWDPEEPAYRNPPEDVSVDVFVPSYDEDAGLLRGTLQACLAMDYPHRTYLLDDGNRDEIRELCADLGVHYIRRDENLHAKAGNLNNALDQTDGELLAIFDADHVPEPHFLTRLLGYFQDEKVGLVQTPHAFYNFDTFQGRVNYEKGLYWDEGQTFYNVIQPGRNYTNSVVFAGSAAMFRRKALEEVGYIATETITEDMHTGIRMSAAGWRTVYISERLIAGFGASDVTTFHSQRMRWAQGNLSILFHDNPLTMKGLDWKQRLTYFGSIIHWAGGLRQLVTYLTPIMMLLTGVAPVTDFTWTLATVFLVYLGMMSYTLKVVFAGYSNVSLTEYFNMANFWTQIRATWRAVLSRKRAKFVVTKKGGGSQGSVLPHILPQLLLLMLGINTLIWGWTSQMMFRTNLDWIGLGIATFLILYNSRFAVAYIRSALVSPSQRDVYRHNVNLPLEYAFTDHEGNVFEGLGVTTDISDGGLGFVTWERFPASIAGTVCVPMNGHSLNTNATVRYVETRASELDNQEDRETPPSYRYGVEFAERDKNVIDGVNRVAMRYAVVNWYNLFDRNRSTMGRAPKLQSAREHHREEFKLPVRLQVDGDEILCVTGDLSPRAFRVSMATKLEEGSTIPTQICTPLGPLAASCLVTRERLLHQEPDPMHEYVLGFDTFEGQGRSVLQSLLDMGNEADLRSELSLDVSTRGLPVGRPVAAAAVGMLLVTPLAYGVFRQVHDDDLMLAQSLGRTAILDDAPDLEELERIYEGIMSMPQPTVERLILLKDTLEDHDQPRKLVEVYRALASRLPADADVAKGLVSALTRADQTDESARLCQSWIGRLEHQPGAELHLKDFCLLLARCSLAAGSSFEAAERLGRVSADYPEDGQVRREYAGALVRIGRIDAALEQYAALPPSKEVAMEVINVYNSAEDFELAEQLCRGLLIHHPDDKELRFEFAQVLVWQGRFDEAMGEFQRLLSDHPDDIEIRLLVARTQTWAGHPSEALEIYQSLLDRGNNDEQVLLGYLDAFLGLEDNEGIPVYTIERINARFLEGEEPSGVLAHRLARALVKCAMIDAALVLLERRVELDPSDRELRSLLADTLSRAGEHERAHGHYQALVVLEQPRRGTPRELR